MVGDGITRRALIAFIVLSSVRGQDVLCHDRLLASVPDAHITASSSNVANQPITSPARGRLNTTETTLSNGTIAMGAWAPAADQHGEYIQAMFDEVTMVNGVFTQGRNQGNDHVTLFKIEYTEDGTTWKTINNDLDVEEIFTGNFDGDSVQFNELPCPLFAKGIRIIPMEWNQHVALRFDVSGCYIDNSGVAPTNTTQSFLPGIVTPFGLTTPSTASGTTINLITLIHWFMTHLSNASSTTTPVSVKHTLSSTTTTTTQLPTTTTPYVFLPGIPDPFGTTKRPQSSLVG
ncbi:venom prothrombin activator pseutarin-C non-catalytic subunit-like isoform X1 [Dreissena polymorpha]|uniref:venom prothrombin activator pseutarin-C non-catalytic subunit-like isoform X1 n=1 Tax=Dreissena polymorpha TaxID=45954 RepID=UPI0022646C4E|nr:venom prothrombin activator pseutarin-C non-catalytic subunit-like isoform X1 [Dreissena polymorpha]